MFWEPSASFKTERCRCVRTTADNFYISISIFLLWRLIIIVHMLQRIQDGRSEIHYAYVGWGFYYCVFDACWFSSVRDLLGWFPGCLAPSDVFLLPSELGNGRCCLVELLLFRLSSSSLWCSLCVPAFRRCCQLPVTRWPPNSSITRPLFRWLATP